MKIEISHETYNMLQSEINNVFDLRDENKSEDYAIKQLIRIRRLLWRMKNEKA